MLHVFYRKNWGPRWVEMKKIPGDPDEASDLEYICSIDIPSDKFAQVFREMNCVDGGEIVCELKVRSLSVDDVVMIDNGGKLPLKVMQCASVGWTERPELAEDLEALLPGRYTRFLPRYVRETYKG